MENSDVRLAALTGGLINANGANLGMTFLGARLVHMMLDHAPQSATADAQQPAAANTDMVGASISVKASNSSVKRLPSRAQGTGICVTLPQPAQATRGTSACR
jgi:hypothetical protein